MRARRERLSRPPGERSPNLPAPPTFTKVYPGRRAYPVHRHDLARAAAMDPERLPPRLFATLMRKSGIPGKGSHENPQGGLAVDVFCFRPGGR